MAYSSIPGVLIVRACLCLAIIISGLALRRFGLGLGWPATFVKYGGSILWGAMMLFLVAMAVPRSSRRNVALISAVIAVCVELFRLVHAPWLDAFRLTLVRRIVARPHLLSLGYPCLWRRDRARNAAGLRGVSLAPPAASACFCSMRKTCC
jgi:hypothetical protein